MTKPINVSYANLLMRASTKIKRTKGNRGNDQYYDE